MLLCAQFGRHQMENIRLSHRREGYETSVPSHQNHHQSRPAHVRGLPFTTRYDLIGPIRKEEAPSNDISSSVSLFAVPTDFESKLSRVRTYYPQYSPLLLSDFLDALLAGLAPSPRPHSPGTENEGKEGITLRTKEGQESNNTTITAAISAT